MGIDSSKAKAKMQDFMEIVRLVVSGTGGTGALSG